MALFASLNYFLKWVFLQCSKLAQGWWLFSLFSTIFLLLPLSVFRRGWWVKLFLTTTEKAWSYFTHSSSMGLSSQLAWQRLLRCSVYAPQAFSERILECSDSHSKLQGHLSLTLQVIYFIKPVIHSIRYSEFELTRQGNHDVCVCNRSYK